MASSQQEGVNLRLSKMQPLKMLPILSMTVERRVVMRFYDSGSFLRGNPSREESHYLFPITHYLHKGGKVLSKRYDIDDCLTSH